MTVEAISPGLKPLEDCRQLRNRSGAAARWFANLEFVSEVGDKDYIVFEVALGDNLAGAADGFNHKPEACEMISRPDGCYECSRCDFEEHISVND
jgi:hypothetical protein